LRNKNELGQLHLFEIGKIFFPGEEPSAIREQQQLTFVISGEGENGYRLAKGIIDEIARRCGILDITYAKSQASPQNSFLYMWRDGTVADIKQGKNELGSVGVVSDAVVRQLKLLPLTVAEINLDALIARATAERDFQALPKYPPVFRDIAIVVDQEVTVERVQQAIERAGGELLEDVDLFDVYELTAGEHDSRGPRKGLAFHLKFQSRSKTLTDSEVEGMYKKIERALQQEIGATVR
jgi:phenylalanyl-tRNA synthetase beta chain